MGLVDRLVYPFAEKIAEILIQAQATERYRDITKARSYRRGKQDKQLKNENDNVILNYTGMVCEKSTYMLFGKEVEFQFEDDGQKEYVDLVWAKNDKEILLQNVGLTGAESGDIYIDIVPDYFDDGTPKLVNLQPELMTTITDPMDRKKAILHIYFWDAIEIIGDKETVVNYRKQYIYQKESNDWKIIIEKKERSRWEQIGDEALWQFPFAPVVHGQNLPTNDYLGESDITDDVMELQDRTNFVASNIFKIIKFFAHPITLLFGSVRANDVVDTAIGKMITVGDKEKNDVRNLEMKSDLASSQAYLDYLRQTLFATTMTVDVSTIKDRVGQLSNFGLRVMYQDAVIKMETKRRLYGKLLQDINKALLALNNVESDGGVIVWEDPLPVNEKEQIEALTMDNNLGLVSKETAAMMRGYDYEKEKERLSGEEVDQGNVGEALINAFTRGQ